MCLFLYLEAQWPLIACMQCVWMEGSNQRRQYSEVLMFFWCVNMELLCCICVWLCLHPFLCTDLDTSVEYVCCSCFHLSFYGSNNEPDVGWKYMCINIGIYRNLIYITWYIELEPCLPRKEAITKLMWAPDRELEAELGAFIFFHWSAIERRKKWKKKSLLIRRNTLLNRSIRFSHQTLSFLKCSISLFLHP